MALFFCGKRPTSHHLSARLMQFYAETGSLDERKQRLQALLFYSGFLYF